MGIPRQLPEEPLPPMPEQVVLPDMAQKYARWFGEGEGRLVLLTWHNLKVLEEGQPLSSSLELQVAEVREAHQGRHRSVKGGRHSTSALEQAEDAWRPCDD